MGRNDGVGGDRSFQSSSAELCLLFTSYHLACLPAVAESLWYLTGHVAGEAFASWPEVSSPSCLYSLGSAYPGMLLGRGAGREEEGLIIRKSLGRLPAFEAEFRRGSSGEERGCLPRDPFLADGKLGGISAERGRQLEPRGSGGD